MIYNRVLTKFLGEFEVDDVKFEFKGFVVLRKIRRIKFTMPKTSRYLIQFLLTFIANTLMLIMLNAGLCREAIEAATFFKGATIFLPNTTIPTQARYIEPGPHNASIDVCYGMWTCSDTLCQVTKTYGETKFLIQLSDDCNIHSKFDIYFLYSMEYFSIVGWMLLASIILSFLAIITSVIRALSINQDEFELETSQISAWHVYRLTQKGAPIRIAAFLIPYMLSKLTCVVGFILFFYANTVVDNKTGDSPPSFVSFNDNLMYVTYLLAFVLETVWSSIELIPFFRSNYAEL